MGERESGKTHSRLCFWHTSLTTFSPQRLRCSQGVPEEAVSDYTQLERDPEPYGVQVRSLAVLRNRK